MFKGGIALEIRLREGSAAILATGGNSNVRREDAFPWGEETRIGPVAASERSLEG